MKSLALDIGRRHTGVALLDDATGVPLPLTTITHDTPEMLCERVRALVAERGIDRVIIGLPLLPSGKEGAQVRFVRTVGEILAGTGIPLRYIDERYTTPRRALSDGNAAAACSLLEIALHRE